MFKPSFKKINQKLLKMQSITKLKMIQCLYTATNSTLSINQIINLLTVLKKSKTVMLLSQNFILNDTKKVLLSTLYILKKIIIIIMNRKLENIN